MPKAEFQGTLKIQKWGMDLYLEVTGGEYHLDEISLPWHPSDLGFEEDLDPETFAPILNVKLTLEWDAPDA